MAPPQQMKPDSDTQTGQLIIPPSLVPPFTTQVAVIMVPLPAQGHLNQLLHLSGRLASTYNIPVHYVGAATHVQQAKLRAQGTWTDNVHFHHLEILPFQSPPPDPNAKSKFPDHLMPVFEASSHLRGPVGRLIQSLSRTSRRVVVVHDSLMASVVRDVASVPNAESYVFHSVSAFALYWYICEASGRKMSLDGAAAGHGSASADLLPVMEGCFSPKFLKFMARQYEFRPLSSGCLYNTSRLLEAPYLKLLEKEKTVQNHWAIGPLNPGNTYADSTRHGVGSGYRHKCLEWLHRQPPSSVLYLSFGTTTTLTKDQIHEIASGLEKSKQRFIWVLREADRGDIFDGEGQTVRQLAELPKEFEQRVEGVGLVIREWAPQLEILRHGSVGGFMSHCGWNSCMESITMGVPIVAWPMHSDQPRNSVLVTKVLRMGVMVKEWPDNCWNSTGLVESADIENAVRVLMASDEGDEMRKRAAGLASVVRRSVEAGGVSRAELDSFVAHISR